MDQSAVMDRRGVYSSTKRLAARTDLQSMVGIDFLRALSVLRG